MGYSGFVLAAGDPLVIGDGICSRTTRVQTAILARISSLTADDCGMVTNALLGMIGGALSLSDTTVDDDTDDITTLLAGDLDGLTSLISLDLSSNLLTGLPAGLFSELESLTTLFLQGNALTSLPEGIFSGLTSLRTLNLSNNSLSTLDAGDFAGLALTGLFLLNNDLTSLPEGLFSGLNTLTSVNVAGNPNDDSPAFTLTVAPKAASGGMAAIEVVEGIPFTKITATVTITNGTFSNGMTTMEDVEIVKGETQSDEFAYTVDANQSTITLAVSNPESDPGNILDGTNYNGFMLAAGDDLTVEAGICGRTAEVQAAILSRIDTLTADDCAMVTVAQLQAITGALDLSDPNDADDADDITTLLPGDFDNLTSLTTLNLGRNLLETLPAGIFDDLTSLTQLYLFQNRLQELREGVFSTLTNLTDLRIGSNQLTTLPPGIFSGLTNLAGVNAAFNPNSFALTPTLTEISTGMFAIEIVQGVPFTSVTATVEITDQSNNTTTTTLTISKGMTQSEAFAFNPTTPSARLAISVVSDPINISLHFSGGVGFAGFELGDIDLGICDRTPQVQTAILAAINAMDGVSGITCLTATTALLSEIDGTLNVGDQRYHGLPNRRFRRPYQPRRL